MSIRIITDSASDILPAEAAQIGVTVLPLIVTFGTDEYFDGETITRNEFYDKLAACDSLPTTSQIPPARYIPYFEEAVNAGDDVVVISLSSKLSGTYQSACIAADEVEGNIFVVDSLNAALGQRILVLRAVELANAGLSAAEIANQLNKDKMRLRLYAVLDTLEYLKKGGRISSAVALAGSLLSIKPVITLTDGEVDVFGKARGFKKGQEMLVDCSKAGKGIDFNLPYCVAYTGKDDATLRNFIANNPDLLKTGNVDDLIISIVGAAIGTHIGPGAVGYAFFENE